ncbi:MAG: sodium:proton antiporter NhaD [Candidatus Marinimicrobia bacterium]|nr:sodium:proton antiporter NhaD [Candidatus Neomarinimicrobiota bacterium]MBT4111810.1 sodium:proton antiporter NhaD [Candidatus Neomarinimicrobiota bacterium]MBT4707065.1 sodium:proton antiporter NhaD [Candidatus Neomarinimicrobiota bacterium]MBT4926299.1 sodium:proton antiporter NhaD [Candidatus Neomarinimicrobiota bacterium]MBT5251679.1 sodium:proton antiporter NhaD [Candidatus Neomarinimicrobiota bacterium]
MDLLNHPVGIASLILFVIAYAFVMTEEVTHLRKSKPVLLAAGLIWAMIAGVGAKYGHSEHVEEAIMHAFSEFSQLMLFLLVAMTFINSMTERNVFEKLRSRLLAQDYSYKKLFWITGFMAFFLSPIADNLTTALTMCAVVMAVGVGNKNFVSISCVNIVVAANAGGAFSPFGDITTLMVWQAGYVEFTQFFALFIPSLVNFIIPAFIMSFFINGSSQDVDNNPVQLKRGAKTIMLLFLITILLAVSFENFLHIPPVFGMMTGFSLLQFFGYYLKRTYSAPKTISRDGSDQPFGVFKQVAQAEWDTLLFFYGVIMCVAGLSEIGYLAVLNNSLYDGLGFTVANSFMGIISALVDNIPVMFSVIQMHDTTTMNLDQWLLITLTAGVGGSLLSIGSAPGVALMGQAKGVYTFSSHLKWSGVIFIGYVASILTHLLLSGLL